jgi:hypothetical protein
MTDAKVAGAIKALSFDRETQAYEQGTRFAKNKLERLEVVTAAANTLGASPSYEEWEAYRVQWVDGHAHQNPDLTANASDKAWKEFAKLLDELYGMTKPKSTGAAAVKKSEQREKAQEALLEKYEDTPLWELRDQLAKNYQKLADKPEDKDTKKAQKELEKVIRMKTTEQNQRLGEELKEHRAHVKEMVSKCTDIEKLIAVAELLDDNTEIDYRIED